MFVHLYMRAACLTAVLQGDAGSSDEVLATMDDEEEGEVKVRRYNGWEGRKGARVCRPVSLAEDLDIIRALLSAGDDRCVSCICLVVQVWEVKDVGLKATQRIMQVGGP
jgi:hypothetical protein